MARQRPSVTIVDVARAAGVSKSAAARVLANNGSASRQTREAVLAAADRLGYRPNQLAKAMKSGTTRTIGVVLPDVSNAFFSSVLRGFSDSARAAGFEVILSNTDNDAAIEARSIGLLAEKRIDGLAIAPVLQDSSPALAALSAEGMPIVLIDRRLPDLGHLPLVSLNHAEASFAATEALAKLGHRRIAIVTEATSLGEELDGLLTLSAHDTSLLRPSTQRLLGYVRALEKAGIDYDPDLVITTPYDPGRAEASVGAFLDRDGDATAIYGTDAVVSYGTIRALTERDIRMPEDLSFIGFDDQDWMTLVRPHVSVVEQAKTELGEEAARILVAAIHGAPPPEDRFLSGTLILRENVAPPTDR